ncbi:MAG: hypothetical protein JW839_19815 [Candidatus Lokiarchaeota archaeon]|nr:hypothetical protein [Candidatus Lokiarchaeota archaeon]
MDDQLYKIRLVFDTSDPEGNELTFNLLPLPRGARMVINPKFLQQLVQLAENNPEYRQVQAIKVAQTGQGTPLAKVFSTYYVVFFTRKGDGKKRGILISFEKEKGGMVNAVWPISFRDEVITAPKLLMDVIHDLSVQPDQYENVNLLSPSS